MTPENTTHTQQSLPIIQWIQIATSILTILASFGLWLFRTASTPSLETIEIRNQLVEVTKELAKLQLDCEGYKYRIDSLERREDNRK